MKTIITGFLEKLKTNIKNLTTHNNSDKYDLLNREYYLISLGNDCFPRFVTVMYGLKPLKEQGELSYPFDLCVTPALTVNSLLRNNFKNYYKGLKYDDTNNLWYNEILNIYYNHDKDCNKNNRKKLEKRFRHRIKNFKNVLKSEKHIYFIINNPANNTEVEELFKTLGTVRKDKPFTVIVLDTDNNLSKIDNPGIFVFREKHPFDSAHDWWLEKNKEKCNTYVKVIGTYIQQIIEKDFECVIYRKEKENKNVEA